MIKKASRQLILTFCLLAVFSGILDAFAQSVNAVLEGSADEAIPSAKLMQPAELVQLLTASSAEKPLILQVGSHVLFAEAHIPGAEFAGAGGQEAGLQSLRDRVKGLNRNQFLVLYCGCCPWNRCPNIRPAYEQLESLGFTRVKVLYIAENFGADWADKGYPTTKGR